MRYWNSYDIYWDTYIDKFYEKIEPLFEKYLEHKLYSQEVEELRTIINCPRSREHKIRSKFNKPEKSLFFDIVISYNEYMSLKTESQKKEHIALSFLRDMKVLSKFKPKGFNLSDLENDCMVFFQNIGWLPGESSVQ